MTARAGLRVSWAPPNKRMHATRDTRDVINSKGLGGRVMRGVRSPERSGLMARQAQAGAVGRSNSGMHPTADTLDVINHQLVGGRVMPGVRRRYDSRARGFEEPGGRETYRAASGWHRDLGAA